MTDKIPTLLNKVYTSFLDLMFYSNDPLDLLDNYVVEDVMGYGTTLDEKVFDLKGLKDLAVLQRDQSPDLKFKYEIVPVYRKLMREGNIALIVDEIKISIQIENEDVILNLRMSMVWEFMDEQWKLVHWHGSKPDYDSGGTDTWHTEEWQKKNEELQKQVEEKTHELVRKNRELEIEAALERVRAVALSLQTPDDMLDVCQIISEQLEMLNVSNIRNVQVAIIDESNKNYLNYQYFTPYTKKVFEITAYEKNPASQAMVTEMQKSANSFFIGNMKGKALEEFREWRKKYNQFPDPLLDKSSAVFYYFYSIGKGGLGLTTYQEISGESLEIFKRFHNVFTLAYRRFMDIQNAEAQTKEFRIEAALERIRSRALAMRNSSEVGDVSNLLFAELEKMNINPSGFSIMIFYENQDKYELWRAKEVAHQGVYETFSIKAMFDKLDQYIPGFGKELKSSWTKGKPFFIGEFKGKKRVSFIQANREMANYADDEFEEMKKRFPDPILWHLVFFKHGWFGVLQNEQLPEEYLLLIHRFADVFDFAFTRFLDLKKAEEQAREAKIELSLERIRGQVTAMSESSELLDIVVTMRTEFVALGHEAYYFWYMRWLPEIYEKAMTSGDGTRIGMVMSLPRHIHGDVKLVADWEKSDEPSLVFAMDVETAVDYVHKMITLGDFKQVDPNAPTLDDVRHIGGLTFIMARTKHGEIGYSLPGVVENPPEEALTTLVRFAGVFDLAYRRFEDLKNSEHRNRETQIELTLERVRAKTMAMQKSAELSEVVTNLFHQLDDLGIKTYRCNLGIINAATKHCRLWSTTSDGKVIPLAPSIPLTENQHLKKIYKGWKKQGAPVVDIIKGKNRLEWTQYIRKFSDFEEYKQGKLNKKKILSEPAILNQVFFKQGFFTIHTVEEMKDEYFDIVQRFARVFEQTYTRFLDLQRAEDQARDAVKQASLDRIRGQIASMRTTEDLNQLTPLIWRELNTLEVPFFRCGIFIVDEKKKHVNVYLTTPDGKPLGALDLDFKANDLARVAVASWKKKEVYQTHWNREEFIAWTKEMMKLGQIKVPEKYQGAEEPPESLHLHFIPFAQGMLYVGHQEQLEEEKIDLVKSLAGAFSFAYARYEDFTVLEEAKERVEKALSDLKATQSQLIHAEKMASLGELTAGIAHEIQNPLNFVNNFSDVSVDMINEMNEEADSGNLEEVKTIALDLKQNLEKISHHGKRASSIVKGMLEHSRTSSGEKEPTDINALAEEYLRLAYHGLRAKDKTFNADFRTDFDETLPKINVIPQDIGRVLLNLINNAFYACNERSRSAVSEASAKITVSSSDAPVKKDGNYKPTVTVSTKKSNGQVEIRVKDNGNGIPPEVKDKIFQPFFTTKPAGQGTGLGLSMSYDIITKGHGGELKVETIEGSGTEFIVVLPEK